MPQTNPLPRETLLRFNDFLVESTGLNFKENRWNELERGIRDASKEFGYDDPETCIQWLMSSKLSKKQIEILSIYLTVGETFFFRENDAFKKLENQLLPELIKNPEGKPKSIRIWSAACSTGEEAYSIAMIIDRFKDRLNGWDISILATDINLKALQKAETGVYTEWALRNTPPEFKQDYFIKNDKNSYELKPHIKETVRFNYLNLAEDAYPSLLNNTNGMDIIFCRNVLMYFSKEKAEDVVHKLYRSLVMGGYLIVGPTDSFHVLNLECFTKDPLNTSVFIKCDKKNEPAVNYIPPPLKAKTPPPRIIPKEKKIEKRRVSNDEIVEQATQFYTRGNYSKTVELLRDMANVVGTVNIVALLARSYANLGRLTDAAQWIKKAIDTDKLNPAFHYLHGIISQEQGDEGAAVQSFKKCLYIDPNYILAHFTLGNIAHHQKNTRDARKHLDIALSLLETRGNDEIITMEEGLTAGRLREIIKTMVEKESLNE